MIIIITCACVEQKKAVEVKKEEEVKRDGELIKPWLTVWAATRLIRKRVQARMKRTKPLVSRSSQ